MEKTGAPCSGFFIAPKSHLRAHRTPFNRQGKKTCSGFWKNLFMLALSIALINFQPLELFFFFPHVPE